MTSNPGGEISAQDTARTGVFIFLGSPLSLEKGVSLFRLRFFLITSQVKVLQYPWKTILEPCKKPIYVIVLKNNILSVISKKFGSVTKKRRQALQLNINRKVDKRSINERFFKHSYFPLFTKRDFIPNSKIFRAKAFDRDLVTRRLSARQTKCRIVEVKTRPSSFACQNGILWLLVVCKLWTHVHIYITYVWYCRFTLSSTYNWCHVLDCVDSTRTWWPSYVCTKTM